MITRLLTITGRVQGVGFREALCSQAEHLGVRGWVRNRSDGTVEALVQGTAASVEAAIAWAKHGPPLARVTGVRVDVVDDPHPQSGFRRLPTE